MAALGVVVLAVSLVALGQPRSHPTSAGPTTQPRQASSPGTAPVSRSSQPSSAAGPATRAGTSVSSAGSTGGKLPLVVLNNTTVTGLAAQAAASFRAGGWTVTSDGNYQNNLASTCAFYDPAVVGALAAAQALQAQFPAIKRVQPKIAGLPAGPIVVVLTPGYS